MLKRITPVLPLIIYVTEICDRSSTVPLANGLFIVFILGLNERA